MSVLRLLALAAIVVWSLFPIALVVMASFKPAIEIFAVPPKLLFTPTFANYVELASRWPEFFTALLNSVIVTAGATLLTVAASALAGWVLARQRGPGVTASAFFMIAIRMFPPIVITLPLFPVITGIGLEDT